MHANWTNLLVPCVSLLEKVLRTAAVYAFLLAGLRIAGKRELGQLNPFDLVVLLLLANTVQNAIIGNDNSLVGGLFGAAVLLVMNYVVVRFLFLHPKLDRLAEGDSCVLIHDGHVVERNMKRELITKGELRSAARRQGIEHFANVACARLEVGGALSFVMKDSPTSEGAGSDLSERLVRLEQKLDLLLADNGRNPGSR
jgi:uncharacterized membrane protein YcaP (DUF421 family)